MKLFSNTISTLENAINYANTKQKVISQNIANVDTPNYKAKEVTFKDTLNQTMEAKLTNTKHIPFSGSSSSSSKVVTRTDVAYNSNGNSVDMDKEMTDLATNQIYYNALIERISGKFNSLQTVIRGGK
ncbi:flagellar basal body rod protein FlgB [Bacillus sp. B1-b2]|uniref:flagellar basal body rod protein FlgB n=1 Tax=Bacillus sp. B1-b2 TaxID=2653201 RepID=UPI0012617CFD|nr:flagellar basal body rod protein FlgB [Bacillus sp. B1-b2]KAB7668633.1 flagellar basal body rod protein FlgB [Bacillus sp. B1-b2]